MAGPTAEIRYNLILQAMYDNNKLLKTFKKQTKTMKSSMADLGKSMSIMFAGMAISRSVDKSLDSVRQMIGTQDIMDNMVTDATIPILLKEQDELLRATDMYYGLAESQKQLIGEGIYDAQIVGDFMSLAGQVGTALTGIGVKAGLTAGLITSSFFAIPKLMVSTAFEQDRLALELQEEEWRKSGKKVGTTLFEGFTNYMSNTETIDTLKDSAKTLTSLGAGGALTNIFPMGNEWGKFFVAGIIKAFEDNPVTPIVNQSTVNWNTNRGSRMSNIINRGITWIQNLGA